MSYSDDWIKYEQDDIDYNYYAYRDMIIKSRDAAARNRILDEAYDDRWLADEDFYALEKLADKIDARERGDR